MSKWLYRAEVYNNPSAYADTRDYKTGVLTMKYAFERITDSPYDGKGEKYVAAVYRNDELFWREIPWGRIESS